MIGLLYLFFVMSIFTVYYFCKYFIKTPANTSWRYRLQVSDSFPYRLWVHGWMLFGVLEGAILIGIICSLL